MTAEETQPVRNATWDDARRIAYEAGTPMAHQTVPLAQAIGQTLAEDVRAQQDVPHYASSAMDGWAVAGRAPWELVELWEHVDDHDLPVRGVHEPRTDPLEPGQAVRILTGGAVPEGAFGILRSEHGVLTDEGNRTLLRPNDLAEPDEPTDGRHVRPPGEEAHSGDITIRRGTVLNPAHIAVAAISGHDTLPVLRLPRVSLVLTGDEVVESGLPRAGQVRDTFGPQLPAFVTMLGGHVDAVRRAHDVLSDVVGALDTHAADQLGITQAYSDVVITTGGTGDSDADHIRRAIAELEGRVLLDGVAMRPGHPTLLAQLPDGRFVVALPGNPLAAMIAMLTVAAPLLAGLRGASLPETGSVLAGDHYPPLSGKTRLVPYRLESGRAVTAPFVAAGMLRGLADADGVMVVPAAGCEPDQPLRTVRLPWKS